MLHRLLYWIASKPGLFLFLRRAGRMNFYTEKRAISKYFRGHFKVHESIDLDFGDQSMDAVLLIGVFHNVDAPTSAYLIKEIKRVVKPGGKLLILEDVFPVSRISLVNAVAQRYDPPAFIRTAAEYQALFDQGIKLNYEGIKGYHLFHQVI